MSARDYTDSESETEAALLSMTREDSAMSTPAPKSPAKSSSKGEAASSDRPAQSLKITLRPNLAHLNNTADSRTESSTSPGDRSSLSPPPPIRLKLGLGMKHARSSAMYSDSDDESETPLAAASKASASKTRSPPAKKHKPSKPRASASSSGPSVPATGRKAYNWLTPSSAGASHHGPPDRGERHASAAASIAASAAGDDEKPGGEDTGRDSAPPSEKKKGGRRKVSEGPGKNWRKGLRKGDPLPWKEGSAMVRSSPLATPTRPSVSREASPELDTMLLATATAKAKRERERDREPVHHYARESSPVAPPFAVADPKVLGFPVFPNPIVTPKLVLGPLPKVTSFFAPFDNKPFRKEPTRDWSFADRTITGIGGGTLKFKTWRPGPPSELGRVLAAQREAEALAKQRKKESRESERLERSGLEATPERPPLFHSHSNDSVPVVDADGDNTGDNASEAGDDNESVHSTRDSPTPRGRGAASKRGRPRKSKLANEIILTEQEDEGSASVRPSAEPDTKPVIAA